VDDRIRLVTFALAGKSEAIVYTAVSQLPK